MALFRQRQREPAPKVEAPAPAPALTTEGEVFKITPPADSPAFSPTAHAVCMGSLAWRDFMEGKRDLPDACRRGHRPLPTPQERGLLS